MISTFHGLEVARRGMMTQQAALYTTGHNIANANTPGYTRQRVNFTQTEPYPPASMNRPQIPGQMGTGVKAGDIQRIRDSFTDMQFRTENSKLGYWQAKAEMLTQMEDVMNEPSDTGLSSTLDQFWNALQDLAVQPQNDGARRVVRERGISLANTFNYMSNSLKAIQKDYRNEIDASQQRINSILRQINAINKEIGSIEPHGYLPNDLYDERDRLIDELSSMMNIRVEVKPSGGLASANAEGIYDIYLATPQGDKLNEIKLIDAEFGKAIGIQIQYQNPDDLDSPVTYIEFLELNDKEGFANSNDVKATLEFSTFNTNGKLKGYIEGYGYKDGADVKGIYNEMLADLDEMAFEFATKFNEVHQSGWSLNDIREKVQSGLPFFAFGSGITSGDTKGAAASLKVADEILKDVQNIAAAAAAAGPDGEAFIGNGSNALNLANVKDIPIDFGVKKTNVQSFYQGMIGKLGDNASEALRMTKTAGILKDSVELRRMSISSVSLDEEMTNLIKFQHAYNAAARNITMIDEMLDKIINGMGIVGR
ncbi:flagellar hook-associated protein FlgK [Bacillus sp. FJAT-29790]|uniref:flagellar hook-associated protein FlgK n=1 Tax=Bacillus sp. FJAT-29790 TaxID=1895002 RepID=UPI001C210AB6|nr:flagellar hook-associated protein FlgK [Bacillus sp. FJAT-29790]MBU8881181.1 flagellar hook-associated protein FlgK [Bacillus sp. FJAT-29790]